MSVTSKIALIGLLAALAVVELAVLLGTLPSTLWPVAPGVGSVAWIRRVLQRVVVEDDREGDGDEITYHCATCGLWSARPDFTPRLEFNCSNVLVPHVDCRCPRCGAIIWRR